MDMERHDHPVIASIRIIDPDRGDLVFPPPIEAEEEEEMEGEEDDEATDDGPDALDEVENMDADQP
jgi:hypothetical protein